MSWNYRVIEFVDPDGEPWRAIHEVHYDDAGKPSSYSEDAAIVMSSDGKGDVKELGWVLDRMREALEKPVMVERDFNGATEPTK